MGKDREEKQARKGYNSRSLMEGYNSILNQDLDGEDEELAEEYVNDGLMSTYNQMLDTYREGTIDKKDNNKEK